MKCKKCNVNFKCYSTRKREEIDKYTNLYILKYRNYKCPKCGTTISTKEYLYGENKGE